MNVRLMSDLDLQGKTVVFREDLNVPVKEGKITSDKRIRAAIPSLRFALDKGAGIIVLSHLGRPEEGVYSEEASLAPVAKRLEELLGVPVRLEKDYLDGVSVKPGECVLCENVRFNKGEKKNNEEVARKLAALGDVYVMDAFAHGAPRAGFHRRGYPFRQGRLRGPAHGRRTRSRNPYPPCAQASAARHHRRLQGFDQT